MESIFKDGYLKPEFINPNYRGLVGWPCERQSSFGCGWKIAAIIYNLAIFNNGKGDVNFKISQFTPKDIPVGELCWFGFEHPVNNGQMIWNLWKIDKATHETIKRDYTNVVPYLIAETPEKAEELKDWWK